MGICMLDLQRGVAVNRLISSTSLLMRVNSWYHRMLVESAMSMTIPRIGHDAADVGLPTKILLPSGS
jgi:hypothetical protein